MTAKQYYFCVSAVANYSDPDAYVSDLALSTIWGDTPDAPIPPERLDQLRSIYAAASRTVREIVAHSGLSQAAFAERYCIPKRTVENWCTESRGCPIYLPLLLQRAENLITF